jgi:glutamate--cysteine ligase
VQVNLVSATRPTWWRSCASSWALQPLATALFANSPFLEGRPSGFLSLRGRVWTDTDPDRTGIPAVAFELGFGFERFADFVLDVPMYFIMREGTLDRRRRRVLPRLHGGAGGDALAASAPRWATSPTM